MKPLTVLGLGLTAVLTLRAIARRKTFDFHGRVVFVTGGGRGLGLAVARELGRRGASLALCSRSEVELTIAREEFAGAGVPVATRVCDVRDADAVKATVAAFEAELGAIDVVVNVAGVIEVGPIDALTLADYRDAIDTNLFGGIHTTEAVRESMVRRREGRIVNVTSLGGKIPIPHLLPYSTSKFAFVGYSEGLRTELARYGVVVTTIVPGLMRTGSPPQATFAGQPEKEYAMFAPSDSLPFTSVSAETARTGDRRGVRARRGRARDLVAGAGRHPRLRARAATRRALSRDVRSRAAGRRRQHGASPRREERVGADGAGLPAHERDARRVPPGARDDRPRPLEARS